MFKFLKKVHERDRELIAISAMLDRVIDDFEDADTDVAMKIAISNLETVQKLIVVKIRDLRAIMR